MPFLRVLALCLFLTTPAVAKPHDYALDPVHTRLVFRVDHAGLSQAMGSFSGITGHLRFDPDDIANASVDVVIALATLDFGDPDWRQAVLASSYLAEKKFPLARFVSTRVEPGSEGGLRVFGQLQLRGVSHELVLDARLNAIKRHPLTLKRSIGFSATGTVQRSDFGLTVWPRLIGETVALQIELEATRVRRNHHGNATRAESAGVDSSNSNNTDTEESTDADRQ